MFKTIQITFSKSGANISQAIQNNEK